MTTRIHPTLDELVKLQYEARDFSLLPRQPVHSLLSGRHASRLRGRGLTFEELRRYRPGDDIRTIDWRATARLRSAQVRVYTEERDRPVLLIVDQRTTMFFGSSRTTKATVAADAAALAAWRTIERGDRVGAIIFGDDECTEIKPHRSRGNVLRICHELVRFNHKLTASGPAAGSATFNDALLRAANVARHDHLIVLVTDYDGDDQTTQQLSTRLAAHNDVLAVLVYDPLGVYLPANRDSQMQATDGTRQMSVPASEDFSERFAAEFRARLEQIRQRLRAVRIPILPLCTHEPVTEQVLAAIGKRR